ncbi:MAG: hypothetical protein ACD_17C00491G0001 [uncultured bacterium]|nr:MAG: hypothetical protein ACD_17C00491G0001 [uncultured bacterium]OGN55949.1 MAG: hypothetical protein A2796_05980 [Chlamydiae bacterium RIFCSPHIGHO2_01_FULL_44_39]OGN60395.1 MAG: hypothetical protein A3D96_07055 [Chlamydiae bacterium RIFCSPHIGHO2_12_FULL_44_59]OGN66380.1 MAG: hypothetical protein A2978_07115 [Chlamydiae bacterium RIFCSPLOWO2_01_FULL_44_52]OGN69413.1 MAG: hypothetical protein A3I67_06635 [Chlamydiae bacterium RIFCSPLOWO2_02_FULL_45_22]OGN70566.1 MAG: hypothetical protein A3
MTNFINLFTEVTLANLETNCSSLDLNTRAEFMKYTLGASMAVYGVQGALRLAKGVQTSVMEVIKGGLQAAAGVAGTAFIHSLNASVINTAHEGAHLALASAYVAKFGIGDLVKGCYGSGLCKLLLGIGGIACAAYYVYNTCFPALPIAHKSDLSKEQMAFLKAHHAEIDQMYDKKAPCGKWRQQGRGLSKIALEHPEFPGMLVKIPASDCGYRTDDDLKLDSENRLAIESIARKYGNITLPQYTLWKTQQGPIIITEKLTLVAASDVPDSTEKQNVIEQFNQFQFESRLCDLDLEGPHNAGFLADQPLQIGVIDYDCRHKP